MSQHLPPLNFDATQTNLPTGATLLPEAIYDFKIVAHEYATKTDTNETGLKLKLQVASGDHFGVIVTHSLSLWYKNEDAQRIAAQELSAYCHATGVPKLTDASQLYGKPFRARVILQEFEKKNAAGLKTGEKQSSNKVTQWFYSDGSDLVKGQFGLAGAPQAGTAPQMTPHAQPAVQPVVQPQAQPAVQAQPQVQQPAQPQQAAPVAAQPAWAAPQ